ncbi:MAG: hypothetical protein EBR82_28485 [Caulobacteraceae bacterium]|nr:hypothetical protein [Caulobacteraceae bacterium]
MSQPLEYTLKLASSAFTGPLGQARAGLANFQRTASATSGGVGSVQGNFTALVGTAGRLGAAIGGLAAAWQGLKTAVGGAARMESTSVAFKTLIGDAGLARQTIANLKKMGAETPFEFPELADAGRKLIAFGESADTVVDTLRRVGDVASGVQAPIGDIAEIYGKARVQGRLFAEDINQLTGRGIPIIGELAKMLRVSESDIRGLTEAGKIGFPQIEQAFRNMTAAGGKFHGMMAEQSRTTYGLFSNLKDSINNIFTLLGTPINDALRPLMTEVISLTDQLGQRLEAAIGVARNAVAKGRLGEMLGLSLEVGLRNFANGAVAWFKYVGSVLKAEFTFVFSNVKSLYTGAFNPAFAALGSGLTSIFAGGAQYLLGALTDTVGKFGGALVRTLISIFAGGAQYLLVALTVTVGKFGGALVRTLSAAASGAWQALKDAFTNVADWLGNKLAMVTAQFMVGLQNIPGLGSLIVGDFRAATAQLQSAAAQLNTFTQESITTSAFAILDVANKALDSGAQLKTFTQESITTAAFAILDVANKALDGAKNKTEGAATIQNGVDAIKKAFEEGGKVVADNFEQAFDIKMPQIADVAGAGNAQRKLDTFFQQLKPQPLDNLNKAANTAATALNSTAKAADANDKKKDERRIQGFSRERQGERPFGIEAVRRRTGEGFFGGREGAQRTENFFRGASARRAQETVARRAIQRAESESRSSASPVKAADVTAIRTLLEKLFVA